MLPRHDALAQAGRAALWPSQGWPARAQDIRPKKGGPPVGPKLVTHGDAPMAPYAGSLPTFKNPCPC
jgi:hypothetical protein